LTPLVLLETATWLKWLGALCAEDARLGKRYLRFLAVFFATTTPPSAS
jgi:hypothetical protein